MSTPVLDAHLHLWRLPRAPGDSPYAWITPDLGPLHRDVTPEQAATVLAEAGVGRAVLVQADDTLADTAAMLEVCERHPWAVGVVGWVQLDAPHLADAELERWREHPCFRGVRHLVHGDPRPDFLELPPVRRSLRLVAEAQLPYDVPDAYPRHLAQVGDLVEALPELTVVVDHLGKPPLAAGPGSPELAEWSAQLRRVAAAPHAVAKVSGLRIPGARYDLATLRPALDVALDAFGANRLMYGGDWPMTLPAGGYRPTLDVLRSWVGTLAPDEQRALWHGTAERVYAVPPGAQGGSRRGDSPPVPAQPAS